MVKEGSSDYKKVRKRWFFKELLTEWFFVEAKMVLLWHRLKNVLSTFIFKSVLLSLFSTRSSVLLFLMTVIFIFWSVLRCYYEHYSLKMSRS